MTRLNPPLPPFNKGGKTASLVREESRSDGGFENTLCHSERSEESQNFANIVSKKLLNYPTSTLPCNARPSQTRGAEVQDDVYGCHSEVKAEELQSCIQRMVCPSPPPPQHYASLRYTSSQSSFLACSFCIPQSEG